VSQKALNFVSFVSGSYDNKVQTQQAADDHDFIQFRFIPVEINCFQGKLVYFAEEADNDVIQLRYLSVVSDGIEDTVSVNFYNITDNSKYKFGEFNVESLSNISCGDIHEDQNCKASFQVRSGFVYGNVPYCFSTVNGKHPRFAGMFTCNSFTVTVPMFSHQTSPMEPYELDRTGKKYPLINPDPGYVSPCDN
ncbi:unnamed protein product, partial [Candidula unifasciata]